MTQFISHRTWQPARWGAWSELFDDFRRDVNASFDVGGPRAVRSRGVYPPVNLHETADAFILRAELPGVAPEDIDVSLEGSTVTLSGQRKIDYAAGDGTAVHRRERQSGHFRRAFELPAKFDVDQAEAVHRAGVLELRLPKTPEARSRQITVQTS
ncbi:MAG: Hsp20/alpha crystallin family protein [Myxococcota bacterium]